MKNNFFLIVVLFLALTVDGRAVAGVTGKENERIKTIPLGKIDQNLNPYGYPDHEILDYDVSWTGGIKIGELRLETGKASEGPDIFTIRAEISTKGGAVHWVYPINDTHITWVRGLERLPFRYEVWQDEGYSYKAHRITEYEQERGRIRLWKNEKAEGEYSVEGIVNNEFTSFFNSRLMNLVVGEQIIVPTFADKKRVEVVVNTITKKQFEKTVIGPVQALEVMPVMTFRGLYDKKGDTVIWYTDDECRIPVLINSKIVIGSLTAELVGYENSACKRYRQVKRQR
ncbi:DUF3108 domain-containing protein [Desulfomarina sp.]